MNSSPAAAPMMRLRWRYARMLAILILSVLIPRINTASGYAQGTALGTPPGPAVVYEWPRAVRWQGPGLLVVTTGGAPYLLDSSADFSERRVRLGGDVRAEPYAGMRLEVRDADGRTLASDEVRPWVVALPGVRG